MFCTNCGHQLPDNASACLNCATRVRRFSAPPNIPNYLVQSILVTFCCCLPAGIIAVVFAAQVNSKLAGGDIAGAQKSSANAKLWSWIGFGIGAAIQLLYAGVLAFNAISNR